MDSSVRMNSENHVTFQRSVESWRIQKAARLSKKHYSSIMSISFIGRIKGTKGQREAFPVWDALGASD